MLDTAQPLAAETDPVADAAQAFKVSLGQAEAPEPLRDDRGRFASAEAEEAAPDDDEEIEAAEAIDDDADVAENVEETDDEAETAEEAQSESAAMPSSWAKEDAELWASLPPEAQARIAEREGQRDTAVNLKFQEAANLRKANEAIIQEAATNRDRFAQLAEAALAAIRPQEPPLSMLDVNSDDYDPDAYHLRRAQFEQQSQWLNQLAAHQQEAAQAKAREEQAAAAQRFQEINSATRDALFKDVPDLADQAKAQGVFDGLIDYAIKQGAPADLFQTPTTALEWHILWKAQQFDLQQAAKARVAKTPAPEPKKPQPAVRPGVATSRSAAKQAQVAKDFKRLSKTGSIEDGAAVWKHFLKG